MILLSFYPCSSTNPRQLCKNINRLLHRSSLPALLSYDSLSLLCQSLTNFLPDKIYKRHTILLINRISTSPQFPPSFIPHNFSSFMHLCYHWWGFLTHLLVALLRYTNCDLDPIPTSLLKQCSHTLLSTITNIINLSLSTGIFLINLTSVMYNLI